MMSVMAISELDLKKFNALVECQILLKLVYGMFIVSLLHHAGAYGLLFNLRPGTFGIVGGDGHIWYLKFSC